MPRQFTFTLVWKFLLYLYCYIFCSTHPPPRPCIYGNECEEWPCWWLVSGHQRPNMVRMPWRILPYLLIIYLNYHLSLIHTLPATRGMARRGHLGQEPDDGDQFEFVTGRWVSTWTVFWWVLDSDRRQTMRRRMQNRVVGESSGSACIWYLRILSRISRCGRCLVGR